MSGVLESFRSLWRSARIAFVAAHLGLDVAFVVALGSPFGQDVDGEHLVEILEGVAEADEIYPEAERMRWIMEERERKANKRWFWQKPKESADKQDESESAPAQSDEATEQEDEPVTSEEPDTDQLPEEDSQPVAPESPEAS